MIDAAIIYLLLVNAMIVGTIGLILLLRPFVRRTFGAITAYRLWLAIPITCVSVLIAPVLSTLIDNKTFQLESMQLEEKWDDVTPLYSAPQKRLPDAAGDRAASVLKEQDFKTVFTVIWTAGIFFSVGLLLIRENNLRRKIGILTYDEAGYYSSSNTHITPMLVGVFSPQIIVPENFKTRYTASEQSLILMHERAHQAACDHIINAIVILTQCINWFNPFIYIARSQLILDQELACDARVLTAEPDAKRVYMRALMKAQHISYDNLLRATWAPNGDHPLILRVKQLTQPIDGLLTGAKRYFILTSLFVVFTIVAIMLSPFQTVNTIIDNALHTASVEEYQLVKAVTVSDHETVLNLLNRSVDPNINISPFGTPLIIASEAGDIALIKMLVNSGANVNYASRGQGFPLLAAIEGGNQRAVNYLLSLGAQPNVRVIENDTSPLVTAARLGKIEIATILLEHSANPNMIVEDEGTALIAASAAGQIQMVDLLIRNEANIHQSALVERRNRDGSQFHELTTAFEEAKRTNHQHLSKYLGGKVQNSSLMTSP